MDGRGFSVKPKTARSTARERAVVHCTPGSEGIAWCRRVIYELGRADTLPVSREQVEETRTRYGVSGIGLTHSRVKRSNDSLREKSA